MTSDYKPFSWESQGQGYDEEYLMGGRPSENFDFEKGGWAKGKKLSAAQRAKNLANLKKARAVLARRKKGGITKKNKKSTTKKGKTTNKKTKKKNKANGIETEVPTSNFMW